MLFLLSVALYAGSSTAAECEHVVTNHWGSGFQAEIQITNTGSTPINNWTVTWGYSDSTTVTNVWNADSTGTNPVTATSPSWLGPLAPGATWSIGLIGNGAGAGVTISGDTCGSVAPLTANLQLSKTWVNGTSGDQITATTIGLANNATIASVSGGSNTNTGASVLVKVGETATMPAEIFISGTATNYIVSDWVCDDAANSTIAAGDTLTLTAADAGNTITCALTNEFNDNPADTACEQVIVNNWGSGFQAEIQITNTSSTAIDDWTATWGYSDGTTVTAVWNANSTGSNPVTATPPGWFTTLAPGATHSIGFTANGAGNLKSLSCSTVSMEFVTLTLSKELTNDNGGTATALDWVLEANMAGGAAELSGVTGVTSSVLSAGDYELSETGPSGYTRTSVTCDSGVLAGEIITLAAGDIVNCIFYNDDQPVSLTLVKVVNNSIGTATASEWTLDASVAGLSILSGVTGTAGVTSTSLSVGDYVLSELNGPAGYRLDSLFCDAGSLDGTDNILTLTNGDVAVCTFTNRDIVSDLSVTKSVDDPTPNIGDIVSYTLELTNFGPDPATNVVVDDLLPSGLAFVSGSMAGGDVQNQTAPNLEWTINYIGVGAANRLILQYQATVIATP